MPEDTATARELRSALLSSAPLGGAAQDAAAHDVAEETTAGSWARRAVGIAAVMGLVVGLAPMAAPAETLAVVNTKPEIVRAPANPKTGSRSYVFERPANFKRLASPLDPSGYVFRSTADSYFTFATRVEQRPNAFNEFTPQAFIDDYRTKFVDSTGSSFTLIKGGNTPDRVDSDLGVKYFEVEYVVKTQLGFTFDTLKSLHFITTFAASNDCIHVLNCQALDDNWATQGPVLRKVTDSFVLS